MRSKHNGFGIAGFVISIISLVLFPLLLGLIAIVFGSLNKESGFGITAIIIGIISMFWGLFVACSY